jgi:hypothetical protein
LARCSICGEWSGVLSVHDECERAVASGRESPRVIDARDVRGREADLSADAVKASKVVEGFAVALVPIGTLAGAIFCGHLASADDEVTAFVFGAVLCLVATLFTLMRVRMSVRDLQRRHLYMDRT